MRRRRSDESYSFVREVESKDIEVVGGKNASIGEMISRLAGLGVSVPAFRHHCRPTGLPLAERLDERIREVLATLEWTT